MRISGSGSIAAGTYEEPIEINGSAKALGDLSCPAFSASGSVSIKGNLTCTETVSLAGCAHVSGALSAKEIHADGSLTVDGEMRASGVLDASGCVSCDGNVKGERIDVSGALSVRESIDAESLTVSGSITCDGLISAETLRVKVGVSKSRAVRITGNSVEIGRTGGICLFRKKGITVSEGVEGDTLTLDGVTAPLAIGKTVKIGRHCKIDCVRYSESIDVHPKAKVGKVEKV